ncbi:MAG: DUF1178 family protein [Desulfatiglans sp.]|nr:DUF1178 family protein [Desulfatiglans sp.]
MIAFDLMCANGHTFEGWFDNLESYERQGAKRLISCPICENTKVKRLLSPVAMKSSTRSDKKNPSLPIDYQKLAMEIVNYIQNEFEDTGTQFTKEALKIHYGATEARNIRGTATREEEKILEDEGVHFIKFPEPDKKNDEN